MLRRRPFTAAEKVVSWVVAIALFGAGAAGAALGLFTHRLSVALAGLGVWCLGALYARAGQLGRPL